MIFFNADIDECSEDTDNCNQICTNTEGSFTCGCDDGYLLDSDETTCNGTYWEIFSLFAFHSLKYVILPDIKNQGD